MVSLSEVRSSNALMKSALPPNLVAIFAGATNGIGETTLREFARLSTAPRVYFLGRSQEAGTRLAAECRALNPHGSFTFIQSDLSLIRNVDKVCADIQAKEKHVNILWLSQGSLIQGIRTAEDTNQIISLMHFSRIRFMLNFLPQLRAAPGLKRVVSCLAGGKEGALMLDNFQGWGIPQSQVHSSRGHIASAHTLCMERLAEMAPEVSFVHDFPGLVRSGIARGLGTLKVMLGFMYFFGAINTQESGERHVYAATSARFPARTVRDKGDAGLRVGSGVEVACGTDGVRGSGVYTPDQYADDADKATVELLAGLRKDGAVEKVWRITEDELVRITGAKSI